MISLSMDEFKGELYSVLDEVGDMLVEKNKSYGDSALNPVRVFSKADPVEQLLVRIDDKLSRISRGGESEEDTELDLLGYLVLLRMARKGAAR
jgi:hypothetical protein